MNKSKQEKIDTIKKLLSGEKTPKDLLVNKWESNLEALFFSLHKRDTHLDEDIRKFKEKFPGRPYTVLRIVRPGEE